MAGSMYVIDRTKGISKDIQLLKTFGPLDRADIRQIAPSEITISDRSVAALRGSMKYLYIKRALLLDTMLDKRNEQATRSGR